MGTNLVTAEDYQTPRRSLRGRLTEDISTTNADWILLLVSLGVGVIDAFTFTDLKVFAANMTGNTVFLALAAAQVNDGFLSASRSSVALVSFWTGSYISGQLGHKIGTKVRWWVAFAFFWQGLLILTAAVVMWSGGVDSTDLRVLNNRVLCLVFLLSFSYGAQATTARGLGINEIPTVVITSAMVDLFGDKNLYKLHNRPRNRRAGFILSIFVGGLIGGAIYHHVNASLAVCISAVIKLMCVPCVLLTQSADSERRKIQLAKEAEAGQQAKIDL